MSRRQEDFAAKHGYTMNDVKAWVLTTMENHKCPVWCPSQMTKHLFKKDTNSSEYRHVLKAMHLLDDDGLIVMDNWFDANNVTVCYAVSRFVKEELSDIPY